MIHAMSTFPIQYYHIADVGAEYPAIDEELAEIKFIIRGIRNQPDFRYFLRPLEPQPLETSEGLLSIQMSPQSILKFISRSKNVYVMAMTFSSSSKIHHIPYISSFLHPSRPI